MEPSFSLVLTGFRAVGKTFLGQLLAKETGLPFIDLDRVIEKFYAEEFSRSLPVPEIFKKCGPIYFRELEYKALKSLEGNEKRVIALGGGTLVYPQSRRAARYLGRQIYLFASKKTLWERNLQKGLPSFLNEQNFDDSVAFRDALFRKEADEILNLDVYSPQEALSFLKPRL